MAGESQAARDGFTPRARADRVRPLSSAAPAPAPRPAPRSPTEHRAQRPQTPRHDGNRPVSRARVGADLALGWREHAGRRSWRAAGAAARQRRRDPGPDVEPRAVEPALDRVDADPQHRGHLGRGQPLDVAQHQHLAVLVVELGDRALEHLLDPPRAELLVGARPGVGHPHRVGRGVERAQLARRELALAARLDAVAARDRVQPGRQRRSAAEVADAARHRDQRLLDDVLGDLGIAAHLEAEAVDPRLVLLDQPLERGAIAGAGGVQQGRVGGGIAVARRRRGGHARRGP
jgi:hypothetical protein